MSAPIGRRRRSWTARGRRRRWHQDKLNDWRKDNASLPTRGAGVCSALCHRHWPSSPSPSTTSSAPRPTCISAASSKTGRLLGSSPIAANRRTSTSKTVIRMNRDTLYSSCLVRSRCRAGHDHAAGRRQAVHVADDHQSRTTTCRRFSTARARTPSQGRKIGTRYVEAAVRTLVDPARPERRAAGSCASGHDQGQLRKARENSKYRIGIRPVRRKCAMRCSCSDHARPTSRMRSAREARSIRSCT